MNIAMTGIETDATNFHNIKSIPYQSGNYMSLAKKSQNSKAVVEFPTLTTANTGNSEKKTLDRPQLAEHHQGSNNQKICLM